MRSLARAAFILAALLTPTLRADAQAPRTQGTAVVAGRVTISEKGAAGVTVALYPLEFGPDRTAITSGKTDAEGNYRLTNVPAGRFNILVIAPAYVGPGEGPFSMGRVVTVAEGEEVEKTDFALVRGGVITGRVRDADGSPVIGERIQLNPVGQDMSGRGFFTSNPFMYETDDRGVYRLYGVTPGKYTICVGESPGDGEVRFGVGGRGYYSRTYYPDASEASKATVIEISAGTEVTNADITVGRKSRSFVATGRVVDESGKPVAGTQVGLGSLVKDSNDMGSVGWGSLTDSDGRFHLNGLLPGRYATFVLSEGNSEGYSDAVKFEVTDADLSGLQIVLRRGATLSGVAVIEGTTDPKILTRLSQLNIAVGVQANGLQVPSFSNVRVAPDGSWRAIGLRPGKARVYSASYPQPLNLVLTRIERDGVPAQEIEITPGANISGVRVVFEYAGGRIRGQVKIENGPLPAGMHLGVSAHRRGDNEPGFDYMSHGSLVDARGQFLIEGLPAGEYELTLEINLSAAAPPTLPPTVKQTVSVANDMASDVTLTLDLNARRTGGDNE